MSRHTPASFHKSIVRGFFSLGHSANLLILLVLVLAASPVLAVNYTVNYQGNNNSGGSVPANQTKIQGTPLILANNTGNLVRTGFFFTGWNKFAWAPIATHYDVGATYSTDANLTLYAEWNANPVANNAAVNACKNLPLNLTLTSTDAESNPRTYSVLTNPANGVLSGTAPNLTYTPNTNFLGSDSFTFKVNDGYSDSAPATISITVSDVQVVDFPATTQGTVKTFKVAILMINTQASLTADKANTAQLESCTAQKLGDIFFQHEHGSNSFIKEASYGKYAMEGRVVGWLNCYNGTSINGGTFSSQADYYLSLANNYLNYRDYDIFIVYGLADTGGQQTGWLYPQQSFTTPQGVINNVGITWMVNSEVFDFAPLMTTNWSSSDTVLPTTSWSHELLHTFGVAGHSNSYNCGNATLDPNSASDPVRGYGGCFSIMGEYSFSTHPDALMKSRIGWLTPAQIPEISSSGNYEIKPLETNDGQTKALVIPVNPAITHSLNTSTYDALIVEYRTATGFDRYLQRLAGSSFLSTYSDLTNINTNGVLVYMRYANTDTDATALLDMNPTTPFKNSGIKIPGNVGKFADAILPINNTFTWNNIQITPIANTSTGGMLVNITINPPAPAFYAAWTQRSFSKPFSDSMTGRDPDGDGLINLVEFAFGTDPTVAQSSNLATNGTVNGRPLVLGSGGGGMDLWFVRRRDYGTTGSLIYTPQFSSDMSTFYPNATPPIWMIDSSASADHEIVKIPFPSLLPNGQPARFGRIVLSVAP